MKESSSSTAYEFFVPQEDVSHLTTFNDDVDAGLIGRRSRPEVSLIVSTTIDLLYRRWRRFLFLWPGLFEEARLRLWRMQ